jgi:hypothetical protein
MKQFIARFKTQSPKYFNDIARAAKWVVAAGLTLIAAKLSAPAGISEALVGWLETIGQYRVFGGGLVFAMAKQTVNDQGELEEKINKK